MCIGAAPEVETFRGGGIDTEHVFSADNKQACMKFWQDNYPEVFKHQFYDVTEMAEMDTAKCTKCFGLCVCTMAIMCLDVLIAGFSCKPYSTARTGRHSEGTTKHKDVKVLHAVLRWIVLCQPKCCILENVFGFAVPESETCTETPLQRLLADLRVLVPQYVVSIIVAAGDTFMSWRRRRLYIVLHHEAIGGAGAAARMQRMIKDIFINYNFA